MSNSPTSTTPIVVLANRDDALRWAEENHVGPGRVHSAETPWRGLGPAHILDLPLAARVPAALRKARNGELRSMKALGLVVAGAAMTTRPAP
jgi:hypothetical protein